MFDDKTIQRNQARMEAARSNFDTMRSEIAELLLPHHAHFRKRYISQGMVRNDSVFDEYAALALDDGVSAAEGFTMPRGQKWQKIKLADEKLMESIVVQQWLEDVEDRVFALRNDPKSGFTNAIHDAFINLFGFGEQSIWVDKRQDSYGRDVGLSYQSEHLDGIWVENDAEGNPMRIHRKILLTAEQAQLRWGGATPPEVAKAVEKQPDREFEFIHVIERNPARLQGRIDASGKPWIACYYSCTDKAHFQAGGYRTLRRIISRWERASNESYGRGPASRVLQAIRASQIIMQDRVLAIELITKPPMLAASDDLDEAIIDLAPFGITYGGLDERGMELLKTFMGTIDVSSAEGLHRELREIIDRAFYRHLMQINREMKTHITAARTLEEIAEKGILLAPLARQEKELFAPLLDCELDLAWEMGLLDDMPGQLREYFAQGGGVQTVYDNNLSRMQEASEAAGYFRMAEQVGALAQYDQSVIPMFTREYPLEKVIPGLGRVNGVPARWRATEDEKAARDQADAEAAQARELIEALPALSQAGKNIAEAGAIGGA